MRTQSAKSQIISQVLGEGLTRSWVDDSVRSVAECSAELYVRNHMAPDADRVCGAVLDVVRDGAKRVYTVLVTSPMAGRGTTEKVWGEFVVEVWNDYSRYPVLYQRVQARIEQLSVKITEIGEVCALPDPARFRKWLLRLCKKRRMLAFDHARLNAGLGLPADIRLDAMSDAEVRELSVPAPEYWTPIYYRNRRTVAWHREYALRVKRFT